MNKQIKKQRVLIIIFFWCHNLRPQNTKSMFFMVFLIGLSKLRTYPAELRTFYRGILKSQLLRKKRPLTPLKGQNKRKFLIFFQYFLEKTKVLLQKNTDLRTKLAHAQFEQANYCVISLPH
jgi:hypothetical protein